MMRAKAARERKAADEEKQKKRRKELKKRKREARMAMEEGESEGASSMAAFMRKAVADQEAYAAADAERREIEKRGGVMTDASRRAFYRDFRKVVSEADVLLEVLDARDPLGCQCKGVEDFVARNHPNKRIVYVLNKVDLVPKDVVVQWKLYLKSRHPTILFKATTKSQNKNLSRSKVKTERASTKLLKSTESLGADALVSLLKNYARSGDIKTSIVVGVIGYPNVGKSSVINSLKRSKVCKAGSSAGVTRTTQLVKLDKNIRLIDCPGIVFSAATEDELVLQNAVNVQQLSDPITAVLAIMKRVSPEHLMLTYKIPGFDTVDDFLAHIADKFGLFGKGHIPNLNKAAKAVVTDWVSGKIPYYTLPPENKLAANAQVSSTIVDSFAEEFDLNQAFAKSQNALLASVAQPMDAESNFAVVSSAASTNAASESSFLDQAFGDDSDYDSAADMEGSDDDDDDTRGRIQIDVNELARRDRKVLAQEEDDGAEESDDDQNDAMAIMAARANRQVNKKRKEEMRRRKKKTGFISAPPTAAGSSSQDDSDADDTPSKNGSFNFAFDEESSSDDDAAPVDPNAAYSFATDFRPTATLVSESDSDDSDVPSMNLY